MKSTVQDIINRRSVTSYTTDPVSEKNLQLILEAGKNAPTGRNGQAPVMVCVQDPDTVRQLEKINAEITGMPDGTPFRGAPMVIVVLADPEVCGTYQYDGSLVMGNLLNAAYALGLGARWIHRAKETFEREDGKALLRKWGLPDHLVGIGNCILGHPAEGFPPAIEHKDDYVVRV